MKRCSFVRSLTLLFFVINIIIIIIIIIIIMTVKTYGCHMDPYLASLGRRT